MYVVYKSPFNIYFYITTVFFTFAFVSFYYKTIIYAVDFVHEAGAGDMNY